MDQYRDAEDIRLDRVEAHLAVHPIGHPPHGLDVADVMHGEARQIECNALREDHGPRTDCTIGRAQAFYVLNVRALFEPQRVRPQSEAFFTHATILLDRPARTIMHAEDGVDPGMALTLPRSDWRWRARDAGVGAQLTVRP